MVEPIFEIATGDDKISLINYAIDNKYLLKFYYSGWKVGQEKEHPGEFPAYKNKVKGYRWVQPVALGISPKPDENGGYTRKLLRAWQVEMGVTNTHKPAWKTFLVDEMKNLMVFDSSESAWFKPFQTPDGEDYQDAGDKKFAGGSQDRANGAWINKIDLDAPPGEDLNPAVQKAKPVEPTPAAEPDNVEFTVNPIKGQEPEPVANKKPVVPKASRKYTNEKQPKPTGKKEVPDDKKVFKQEPTPSKSDDKIEDLIVPGTPKDVPDDSKTAQNNQPGDQPEQNKGAQPAPDKQKKGNKLK